MTLDDEVTRGHVTPDDCFHFASTPGVTEMSNLQGFYLLTVQHVSEDQKDHLKFHQVFSRSGVHHDFKHSQRFCSSIRGLWATEGVEAPAAGWLEVLQLRYVLVEIQRLRVGESTTLTHLLTCNHLLHRHLHLLPTDGVLHARAHTHTIIIIINNTINLKKRSKRVVNLVWQIQHI